MKSSVGAIILAAGASSRLGRAKQLVEYRGKTLLQHSIDLAIRAGCEAVVVVLGAHANEIAGKLQISVVSIETASRRMDRQREQDTSVLFVSNPRWSEGQSTSLFAGIKVLDKTYASAALIMVCDQPSLATSDLQNLMNAQSQSAIGIAASAYAATLGVPACFSRSHFRELLELNGDCGAKILLKKYSTEIVGVAVPNAELDVDTVADVAKMQMSACRRNVPAGESNASEPMVHRSNV